MWVDEWVAVLSRIWVERFGSIASFPGGVEEGVGCIGVVCRCMSLRAANMFSIIIIVSPHTMHGLVLFVPCPLYENEGSATLHSILIARRKSPK